MAEQTEDIAAIGESRLTTGLPGALRLFLLDADEPVLMVRGRSAVVGREAIRALCQSVFQGYGVKGGGELRAVEVAGDWGYFCSTYKSGGRAGGGAVPAD